MPGIPAGDLDSYDLPDLSTLGDGPLPLLVAQVVERASDNYDRWAEQVARTGYCSRPVRLRGRVEQVDRVSGELKLVYSTEGEPNNELLVSCGTRKASQCRSCSSWYRGDSFHVVASGLRGGKGVPESVASHPKLFVTFTAPGFGAVHAHRAKDGRVLACRPRDRNRVCPHGVALGCSVRHKQGDPRIGEPICPECFDYQGLVVWNALAPALWKRTTTYLPRELARAAGMTKKDLDSLVRVRFSKVAEYQRRGAIHFHAVIRLDAAPPKCDPERVAPPPEAFTAELLEAAVRKARESAVLDCEELGLLGREDHAIRWGSEIDVRHIRGGAGEMTPEVVAAYVAKYATKFSEGLGLPESPIGSDEEIDALKASSHIRGLVRASWLLGWRHELGGLKLREHAHGLGFGGHFLTKSRRYSTTMGALRRVRREYARRGGKTGDVLDAWGRREDDDQVEGTSRWDYVGWGYRTIGEAYLASSAAARAREERRLAREELANRAA
jgi:hypothetical protein